MNEYFDKKVEAQPNDNHFICVLTNDTINEQDVIHYLKMKCADATTTAATAIIDYREMKKLEVAIREN